MRIAFVGKGGSEKTTVAALLIRHFAASGRPVMAIDADINQHLGAALGIPDEKVTAIPPMAQHLHAIKDYVRGSNPLISSSEAMIKTTPPGHGSRLLRLNEDNLVHTVRLLVELGRRRADLGPTLCGCGGEPAVSGSGVLRNLSGSRWKVYDCFTG